MTALSSNAQYVKAIRGDIVKFDTAVVTEIKTYRAESQKIKAAQNVLNGYDNELKNVYAEIDKLDSVVDIQNEFISSKDRVIENKDIAIKELRGQFEEMVKLAAIPQRNWWVKNKIWVGLIGGLIGGYYICTKIN